jgi:radical SAM-linked protein
MQRFRIEYAKQTALRYTGNLDMQKVWERYLRRATLPVCYSQGFHPQPKIQQASPLPLGFLSEAEIVDIWLDGDLITASIIQHSLMTTGQPGIEIKSVIPVELFSPALQSILSSAIYEIDIASNKSVEDLKKSIDAMMFSSSLPRERRGKSYDLRPLIEDLTIDPAVSTQIIKLGMRLAAREGATGRPDEVLSQLGINPNHVKIIRTALIFPEPSSIHP